MIKLFSITKPFYHTSLRGLMMRALTCHAGDLGSIPGVCLYFILFLSHLEFKIASFGEPYYFGQTSYGIPPLENTRLRAFGLAAAKVPVVGG